MAVDRAVLYFFMFRGACMKGTNRASNVLLSASVTGDGIHAHFLVAQSGVLDGTREFLTDGYFRFFEDVAKSGGSPVDAYV